ncbi:MAG TPA: phosphatase PAP2 family protein [Bradyrhizobium sp.]|nr:phosphatase PAP2 family protein [Bradyrhizobium sp.]
MIKFGGTTKGSPLRPVVAILSAGMVLVTPLVGGHYFTDVIAGLAIAALAIWYTQKEYAMPRDV